MECAWAGRSGGRSRFEDVKSRLEDWEVGFEQSGE